MWGGGWFALSGGETFNDPVGKGNDAGEGLCFEVWGSISECVGVLCGYWLHCRIYSLAWVFLPFVDVFEFVSCVLLLVLSCLVCNFCWLVVCIVVVVVCIVVVVLCALL